MATTVVNTKIGEVKRKIPDAGGLVTSTLLNKITGEVENKMPDVSGLVKKTDYNAKISDTEAKYFATSDYNKFTSEILEKKRKEKWWVDKSDISGFIDTSDLDKKIATIATKAELKTD